VLKPFREIVLKIPYIKVEACFNFNALCVTCRTLEAEAKADIEALH
jgi:hypothetical protein